MAYNILIVDDSSTMRRIISRVIQIIVSRSIIIVCIVVGIRIPVRV